jgi:hypothetical protein
MNADHETAQAAGDITRPTLWHAHVRAVTGSRSATPGRHVTLDNEDHDASRWL